MAVKTPKTNPKRKGDMLAVCKDVEEGKGMFSADPNDRIQTSGCKLQKDFH